MKKVFRKIVVAALALSMVASLAACGSKEEASGSTEASKDVKIGFVVSDMSDAFFAHLVQKMEDSAKQQGVTLTVKECPEIRDKISGIENFVSAGCNVIICHVTDADALKDAAMAAEDAGVKFVSYDSDIEGTSGFIGIDNHEYGYAIGKNAAEWINANFDKADTVKVGVCNYPDYPFLVTREEGILDALKELAPNAKVEVSAKAGYTPEGVDVGDAWVQSNKDLNVIVGINDAGVLGVYESFNSAGIKGDKLGMFGGDATDDALKAIQDAESFKATVSTNMLLHADYFINMSVELAEKGKLDNREVLFPLQAITADNVEEYISGQE
ncbi:MAG: sugar ABC transporter substrate-binding protein [Lachnospiraceae bacterium]|nr:sugar ABC transporter substrate-binding protein [Lachnospiraceae bacterium]